MWTDININFYKKTIRHCCKQENTHISTVDIDKYRDQLFERHPENIANRKMMVEENQLPPACAYCILSQPNSIKDVWNNWSDAFIERKRDVLVNESHVQYIELDIGRMCDMACVYCGPWASTTWAKELGEPVEKTLDMEWKDGILEHLATYLSDIPPDFALTFNVLGGEPLLIMDTYDMIEYIALHCRHLTVKPTMMITTNLNCKPRLIEKLLHVIERTSDVFDWTISVSIENIGPAAEMVRYHLNWDNFEINLSKIRGYVSKIYLTTTFSLFSFSEFGPFMKWAFNQLGVNEYTHSWDFSLNYVQGGFSDLAYCDPDLVNVDNINDIYLGYTTRTKDVSVRKIHEFYKHIDNMTARLGTKEVDHEFISHWQTMSERRGVDYFKLTPLKEMAERYHAQV